jgi:DNA-binding NarL/FixJ family response regulator
MPSVRILIADDHALIRHGLRAVLQIQPGCTVCAEAADGREAVKLAAKLKPDIAILDITMPELNGLEATRRILKVSPSTQVLILSVHDSEQVLREVMATGARGYLLKSDADRDLITAVQMLTKRKRFLTPRLSETIIDGYLDGQSPRARQQKASTARRLSAREREIVQLLAEGKRTKEIATTLGISIRTAETHRSNIMRKLALHSVGELVRYAVRNKIIDP